LAWGEGSVGVKLFDHYVELKARGAAAAQECSRLQEGIWPLLYELINSGDKILGTH
jgi:hypothetical protein